MPVRRITHSPSGTFQVSVPSEARYCEISTTEAGEISSAESSTAGWAAHWYSLPIGQRRGVHFGQRFFTVTFHARSSRKFDFVQCALLAGVLHNQPEIGSGRSRNRNHDRRGTVETDSQRFGRTAVDLEIGYRAIAVTLFYLQRAGGFKGLNRRTYDQGAGGKRFRRGQVDRRVPAAGSTTEVVASPSVRFPIPATCGCDTIRAAIFTPASLGAG